MDFELYKQLKEKGFPQGGSGNYLQNPYSEESVYIPQAQEVLTTFIADPKDWQKMVDAMVKVWIENKK